MTIRAKKSLGQNFLKDDSVLKDVAELLRIEKSDTILEIGPGHGELTEKLLSFEPKKVIAVEKDPELVSFLRKKFASFPNLEVIEGDILEVLPSLALNNLKIAGNIPYYITGLIFRKISELNKKPLLSVFVVQYEVALRASSVPPKTNILSASLNLWGVPSFWGKISRQSFFPEPKVDSGILLIEKRAKNIADTEKYFLALHTVYKQPRKTILNNLTEVMDRTEASSLLSSLNIDLKARPGDMSFEDIAAISKKIK